MVLHVIKMEYTKMKWFNTSLRTLEGAHRKRQEEKRKGGKKEKLLHLCENLHEYTYRLPLISNHVQM